MCAALHGFVLVMHMTVLPLLSAPRVDVEHLALEGRRLL